MRTRSALHVAALAGVLLRTGGLLGLGALAVGCAQGQAEPPDASGGADARPSPDAPTFPDAAPGPDAASSPDAPVTPDAASPPDAPPTPPDAPPACVPAAEVCNGVDDDCNGQIDEGFGLGTPCDGTDGDLCKEGTIVCDASGGTKCSDTTGTTSETCNGVDDDCDGMTDEGAGSQSDPQNCGSCGNVCGDAANETGSCSGGSCVQCAAGTQNCDGGAANGCELTRDADPSCASAYFVGSVSGDQVSPEVTDTYHGESWEVIHVSEDSASSSYLSATFVLDNPPGVDFDLYLYCFDCAAPYVAASLNAAGQQEVIDYRINDTAGSDQGKDVYLLVKYYDATACGSWTLTAYGYTIVDAPTCP